MSLDLINNPDYRYFRLLAASNMIATRGGRRVPSKRKRSSNWNCTKNSPVQYQMNQDSVK